MSRRTGDPSTGRCGARRFVTALLALGSSAVVMTGCAGSSTTSSPDVSNSPETTGASSATPGLTASGGSGSATPAASSTGSMPASSAPAALKPLPKQLAGYTMLSGKGVASVYQNPKNTTDIYTVATYTNQLSLKVMADETMTNATVHGAYWCGNLKGTTAQLGPACLRATRTGQLLVIGTGQALAKVTAFGDAAFKAIS